MKNNEDVYQNSIEALERFNSRLAEKMMKPCEDVQRMAAHAAKNNQELFQNAYHAAENLSNEIAKRIGKALGVVITEIDERVAPLATANQYNKIRPPVGQSFKPKHYNHLTKGRLNKNSNRNRRYV